MTPLPEPARPARQPTTYSETGQTESDLCRAVLEMVCSYFSTHGFSASDLYLDQCIKYLQAELRSVDIQLGFALPEKQRGLN